MKFIKRKHDGLPSVIIRADAPPIEFRREGSDMVHESDDQDTCGMLRDMGYQFEGETGERQDDSHPGEAVGGFEPAPEAAKRGRPRKE